MSRNAFLAVFPFLDGYSFCTNENDYDSKVSQTEMKNSNRKSIVAQNGMCCCFFCNLKNIKEFARVFGMRLSVYM